MKVYLASSWFTEEQKRIMDKVRTCLLESELEVFAPYYDGLMEDDTLFAVRKKTFESDISKMRWADFVVAIVADLEPGTIFEWGYAYGISKPVIAYSEGPEVKLNLMLEQSCTSIAIGIEQLKGEIWKLMQSKKSTE